MSYLEAIILGLVQGLTEFIPVSSSGHLVIFSHVLGIDDAFTFDVLLNFGTLTALIVYYRHKILDIIRRTFVGKEWRFLAKLAAATIPAFAVGLLLGNQIEKLNVMIWVVILMLVVMGIIMIRYGSQRPDADDRELEQSLSWKQTALVGAAQAVALIPGTSRSGITILTGLNTGLSAKRAAEFSFLLAIPTILGASMKVLLLDGGIDFVKGNVGIVLVGNLVSFASGLFAVSFLIRLLSTRGLKDFGWYRIGLAAVLSVLLITGIIDH